MVSCQRARRSALLARPTLSDMDCPFCATIAGGQLLITRTQATSVILDRAPLFPGHCLVVPNLHVETVLDASSKTLADLAEMERMVAKALMDSLGADGVLTLTNTIVSQSVMHLHTHVIPRRRGDGLRGFLWPRQRYHSSAEADGYRDQIRAALASYASTTT